MRTTSFDFDSPEARFKVLMNDEECDEYLEETWTDMRPKSLHIALDGK